MNSGVAAIVSFTPTQLIDPHSLYSLWVPGMLLLIIVGAAVYFAQMRT
ncbi:MAG: hypothetical protein WBA57_09620 [Elainellaceae cyanobacterium]